MANMWDNYSKYSGWDQIMQMLYPSYQNPANSAMPYLNQIGNKADSGYSPYMQAGTGALNQYYNTSSNLATPQGAANNYNTIASGYSTSPYAQYQDQNALQSANQAGAASGMAGTPSEQVALANQVSQINSADENQYINTILGTQNQGLNNLGNTAQMGLQATNSDIDDWIKQFMAQAGLSYAGQMNQNGANKQPSFMSSLISPMLKMV